MQQPELVQAYHLQWDELDVETAYNLGHKGDDVQYEGGFEVCNSVFVEVCCPAFFWLIENFTHDV